jgi:hypothetical protein
VWTWTVWEKEEDSGRKGVLDLSGIAIEAGLAVGVYLHLWTLTPSMSATHSGPTHETKPHALNLNLQRKVAQVAHLYPQHDLGFRAGLAVPARRGGRDSASSYPKACCRRSPTSGRVT